MGKRLCVVIGMLLALAVPLPGPAGQQAMDATGPSPPSVLEPPILLAGVSGVWNRILKNNRGYRGHFRIYRRPGRPSNLQDLCRPRVF